MPERDILDFDSILVGDIIKQDHGYGANYYKILRKDYNSFHYVVRTRVEDLEVDEDIEYFHQLWPRSTDRLTKQEWNNWLKNNYMFYLHSGYRTPDWEI
jgi:hypothetical protein